MVLPRRGLRLALMMMVVCVCSVPTLAGAQTTLAWDASSQAAGYVVRWGTSTGVYPSWKDVGPATSADISGLVAGRTYVAIVEAYDSLGQFSDPSAPLPFTVSDSGTTTTPVPTGPVQDMNQDGRPDIMWQNVAHGYIAAWPMAGRQMTDSVLTKPGQVPDTNWRIVGSGNFNSDTKPDLVWQHRTEGWLAIWLMDGVRLIDSASMTPARVSDNSWRIRAIADMNGDGKSDLIWQDSREGWIAVWLMDGVRLKHSLGLSPERISDTNWKIVGAGDINRDGKQDFLWQHATEGWIAGWLMNGTKLIESVLMTPSRVTDPNWQIVGMADANADGKADIYWRDKVHGHLALWTMNGRSLTSSMALKPEQINDPNWRIVAVR